MIDQRELKLPARRGASPFSRLAIGLARDRRGVAAVEFALIVPMLLVLYFVTMEISQAIETSKKVSRVASMTADLITQQPAITSDEVAAVMRIGEALLQPYNRSDPTITVTAIRMDNAATPTATVAWSQMFGTPDDEHCPSTLKNKNDVVADVPTKLRIPGSFLVQTQTCLAYSPVITWSDEGKAKLGLTAIFDPIVMGDTYYLRPRMSDSIPCANC